MAPCPPTCLLLFNGHPEHASRAPPGRKTVRLFSGERFELGHRHLRENEKAKTVVTNGMFYNLTIPFGIATRFRAKLHGNKI